MDENPYQAPKEDGGRQSDTPGPFSQLADLALLFVVAAIIVLGVLLWFGQPDVH